MFALAGALWRRISARTKVHHLYYALALFDLIAVGIGLALTHHVNGVLYNTVNANLQWSALHDEVALLRTASARINAPGKQVFESRDVASERQRMGEAIAAFWPLVQRLKEELGAKIPAPHVDKVMAAIEAIEGATYPVADQTRAVLGHIASGNLGAAGSQMATLDQSFAGLQTEIDELMRLMRRIENSVGVAELANMSGLQRLEYLLGFMMVTMVLSVAVYGHWIGRSFNQRYMELEVAHADARTAESAARAYSVDLEASHRQVTNLNSELASSILKLKAAEAESLRKGRLAQLGQLTATVAHEIRNPLSAIKTSADIIQRKVGGHSLGLERALTRINSGVRRCDQVISELLSFARAQSVVPKMVLFDDWVRRVVAEEAAGLAAGVKIDCVPGLGGMMVSCDPGQMQRVLANLVSNAAEAMVGKGNVRPVNPTVDPTIRISTRLAAGTVELVVADNGPGISEGDMDKIMEPLFTTKSFGVGLGLPAVARILEQHAGGLRVASKPGQGATFIAWFPVEARLQDAA